jgi:enoyl-CoA hydratase/carnithine racemase
MAGLRRTFRALGRAPLDPSEREELERLRAEAFASEDAHEARSAMREKRPPHWKGR